MLPNWAHMKGARVDCAAATISSEEFRESGMEVIGDERGDNVLFAVWDNKKVAGACGRKVVSLARAREDTRLGTVGARSVSFCVSVYGLGFYFVSFCLLVQDHGHG